MDKYTGNQKWQMYCLESEVMLQKFYIGCFNKKCSMKTVKITKHTRSMINDYSKEGETVKDALNRLMDESLPPTKEDRTPTNINMDEDTLERLKKYKAYETESHSDTILRLLEKNKP